MRVRSCCRSTRSWSRALLPLGGVADEEGILREPRGAEEFQGTRILDEETLAFAKHHRLVVEPVLVEEAELCAEAGEGGAGDIDDAVGAALEVAQLGFDIGADEPGIGA